MKCPACSSERVYHSRAKSLRDRLIKRIFAVTFYRCHACNWRRFRFTRGWKAVAGHVFSVVGYAATLGLVIAAVVGLVILTLMFLGVQMPWA